MAAYFRLQTYLIMALGAALGVLTALVGFGDLIAAQVVFLRIFMITIFVLAGIVLGRLAASIWANGKLRKLNNLLYVRCDPAIFLKQFLPVASKVAKNSVEHIDAQTKIAFAYEALGQMDQGLEALEGLKPEELKLHSLQCTSILANQRLRLHLLKEDAQAAENQLEALQELQETASHRAPTLGKQLQECVHLGNCWLSVLQDEECDLDYLREEIALSKNRIHKAEMQLLLGRALKICGEDAEAAAVLEEAVETGSGLYAGARAKAILSYMQA